MADLVIDPTKVSPVVVNDQDTVPAAEAVDAGEAVYNNASGHAALADEDAAAPANAPKGIAVQSANIAGFTVTYIRNGEIDLGDALDSMDFDDTVWLSATPGKLADAAGANSVVVGTVVPGHGATTADKLLRVNL